MILFVDESGKLDPNSNVEYPTLCGIVIEKSHIAEIHESVFQIKQKLCEELYDALRSVSLLEIPQDWRAYEKKKDHIVGHKIPGRLRSPAGFEIKGRELLNEYVSSKFSSIIFPRVDDLIKLCEYHGVRLFATITQRPKKEVSEIFNRWHTRLLERVNKCVEEEDDESYCTLVFDDIGAKENKEVAKRFWVFRFIDNEGKQMKCLLPAILFCDSSITPGLEIADCFAYVLSQTFSPKASEGKRKDLWGIRGEISGLEWISKKGKDVHIGKGIRYIEPHKL